MTDGFQPCFEDVEDLALIQTRELLTETGQVSEGALVDHADETEQLQERVLKRSRGE